MLRETARYNFKGGERKFITALKEVKVFLAINIIMTHVEYPN
jgi:hypothetical protein